jgi:hypothetical protein
MGWRNRDLVMACPLEGVLLTLGANIPRGNSMWMLNQGQLLLAAMNFLGWFGESTIAIVITSLPR